MTKVYGMKTCNIEGCYNPPFSKGLCKNHIPKKELSRGNSTLSSKKGFNVGKPPKISKFDAMIEMKDVFMKIWMKRPHKSEVSGEYLGKEAMSTYFHHILPKSKYPEFRLEEENIILLTLDEHSNVENDMYKYEEVNKRRDYLKAKYLN